MLFLASELMFFAGLFAAYFDLRSQTIVWPPPNVHLNVIESGIGTLLLGYSSGAMLMFTRSLTHNNAWIARLWLSTSIIAGIAFLAIATHGWSNNTFGVASHAYGSVFYAMTGFHALHVTVGILLLCALFFGLRSPALSANHRAGAEAISYYWHFVFIVWVAIWGTIYPNSMTARLGSIAGAFGVSDILGSAWFAAAYALHAGAQLEGLGLLVALGALGLGIILWATFAIPQEQVVDVRDDYPSSRDERSEAEAALQHGADELDRRGFLATFLLAAFGALGVAVLFPLRSLGPRFGEGLYRTKWTPGARLVGSDGVPVRASDLAVGSILTVFPDGHVDDASSQTLLLRLPPGVLRATPRRRDWSPQGYVAFSKICTHAGCPVGLYRSSTYQLLCPCHQSVFDVAQRGAADLRGQPRLRFRSSRYRSPTTDICARGATTRSRSGRGSGSAHDSSLGL